MFRWMLGRFRRPPWAEMMVVVANAAYTSQANIKLIRRRGYYLVMAFARPWRFAHGHALQDPVTHVPKQHSRRCRVPLEKPGCRRTYWTYTKRARLRQIGDVTSVLSKKRRNDGPHQTKILVTNLPGAQSPTGNRGVSPALGGGTARQGVERGDGVGTASGHQRAAAHRTLGSYLHHGIPAAPEVSRPRYPGARSLARLHAQTAPHLAGSPSADRACCRATPAKSASGAQSRISNQEYLSLSSN